MADILTSRGMMPESALRYVAGIDENDNAIAEWEEWRAVDGEVVKRNVHVTLKRGLGVPFEQGKIG